MIGFRKCSRYCGTFMSDDPAVQLLTDKVVFITGGAHRVGAAVSRHLHANGAHLVIQYRSSEASAQALKRELEAHRPESVHLIHADLLNMAELENITAQAVDAFGRLDALINNASSFYPTAVGKATQADWDDLIGTNLRAPFFLSQALAPNLKLANGAIVNLADIYGQWPLKSHSIYSIAKAGLVMLTKSLARELAPEVRVNAIAPGTILWPERELDQSVKQELLSRTPAKRTGDPGDIARTALFLLADAPYITGQVIAVDGGRSIVL